MMGFPRQSAGSRYPLQVLAPKRAPGFPLLSLTQQPPFNHHFVFYYKQKIPTAVKNKMLHRSTLFVENKKNKNHSRSVGAVCFWGCILLLICISIPLISYARLSLLKYPSSV